MGDEQLSLFTIPSNLPTTFRIPKHDPCWDEITREPEETFLMAVDDQISPTAIRKRLSGEGTGRINKRTTSKNGKDYKEYWYDYQYFLNGKRIGRSRYIPKRLLPQIQIMEADKVPVSKILQVLGIKPPSDTPTTAETH
jgi:hypothetical protein